MRAEAKLSVVARLNYIVRISIFILAPNGTGAKMEVPSERGSGVTGLSAEHYRDSHRGNGLAIVVMDGDCEAVEPIVICNEGFPYLEVSFRLVLTPTIFTGSLGHGFLTTIRSGCWLLAVPSANHIGKISESPMSVMRVTRADVFIGSPLHVLVRSRAESSSSLAFIVGFERPVVQTP